MMDKNFNYTEAVAELERLVAKVEDPATGIDDIDSSIRRSDELIRDCRAYLRGLHDKVEANNA